VVGRIYLNSAIVYSTNIILRLTLSNLSYSQFSFLILATISTQFKFKQFYFHNLPNPSVDSGISAKMDGSDSKTRATRRKSDPSSRQKVGNKRKNKSHLSTDRSCIE